MPTPRPPSRFLPPLLLLGLLAPMPAGLAAARQPVSAPPPPSREAEDLSGRLQAALQRHLDLLLGPDGRGRLLKGKTAEGQSAYAFYLMHESTGNPAYRRAAVDLADQILRRMRATAHGVLPIKEKEKSGGEKIVGGGPPAMGFYTARVAYVLHREGGREADLAYLAGVVDRYPWNDAGWWASTVDVTTNESKEPMSKPSIINKTAAMAMAAGILSRYVADTAPELAARLRRKADACIYRQILPAQQPDGFWHYSLTGNDPNGKDVFGYFMLTTGVLMDLQFFHPDFREERLNAALRRAEDFAGRCIVPMTAPNRAEADRSRATPGTPRHYSPADDGKRGFALGRILLARGETETGVRVMDEALRHFPFGHAGQDGAHAADPTALILAGLRR